MTLAFTFPGQGSQEIGMGRALIEAFPVAKAIFQEVDDALGQDLSKIILEGPIETLTMTENAQPALMAVSFAVFRVLEVEFGVGVEKAAFVAGHSLGEYSALAVAGALRLSDTAKLLKLRGQSMQRAVPVGEGAMASLIGPKVDMALAQAAAAEGAKAGVCVVANDNNVGNIVISGSKAGVDAGIAAAKSMGGKAIVLNVSAPFHSPLMAPAAEEMRAALSAAAISAPKVPLVANVIASPVTDPETIRKLLVEQVTGRVRWRESMLWMGEIGKVTCIAELGAGKVLSGMAKRLVPEAQSLSVNDPVSLEAFAQSVGQGDSQQNV